MDALILCWENIIKVTDWKDWNLKNEAKKSILELYYNVQDLIVLHNVDDESINNELFEKMAKYISIPFRIAYKAERTLHHILLKFKKIIYRVIVCLRKK